MSKVYNEDVHFAGGLSLGNLAMGMITASPEPGEVMQFDISGINLEGAGELIPFAQTHSSWPWHAASVSVVYTPESSEESTTHLWDLEDPSGFVINFRRTTAAETNISWCVWRLID